MELHENAKENVWLETIRAMTEKEIAYKTNINKKLEGIKRRQIASITLSSIVILILSGVLIMVIRNINNMADLIKTLADGFNTLK